MSFSNFKNEDNKVALAMDLKNEKKNKMRDIKFRVWTKGKMVIPSSPQAITYFDNRITFWEELKHTADLDAVVMQYTGFDLDEEEIWEGDILREETEDEIIHAVVVWIKEWCMFACLVITKDMNEYEAYLKDGADGLDESMFWTFPLRQEEYGDRFLAGNIYQSQHLLK